MCFLYLTDMYDVHNALNIASTNEVKWKTTKWLAEFSYINYWSRKQIMTRRRTHSTLMKLQFSGFDIVSFLEENSWPFCIHISVHLTNQNVMIMLVCVAMYPVEELCHRFSNLMMKWKLYAACKLKQNFSTFGVLQHKALENKDPFYKKNNGIVTVDDFKRHGFCISDDYLLSCKIYIGC